MKTKCLMRISLISAFVVTLISHPLLGSEGKPIAVGVARVDVTPEGPIRLHGYLARKGPSKGVDLHIFAKALAIGSDAEKPAILITLDGLGFTESLASQVSQRLARKAKIDRDHIVFCASHTHSAPCISGLAPNIFGMKLPADQQAAIDQYTSKLADDLERVAIAALADRKPASLSWGQGKVGFAANRRTPGGPVDHALPLLRATAPDGSIRAIVVGYACHCTTIDPNVNKVSGDWSGHAQAEIERDHPGATALVVIGCGGDANPNPRQHAIDAQNHGRAIADEVNRLLKSSLKPLDQFPTCKLARIALPLGPIPTRTDLENLAKAGGAPGYNAQTQIERLDRGEPLQSSVDYMIASWNFGDDLAVVFLAGEVVVDYALRIKREFDSQRIWTVAYANDDPCYIPSERILKEGGYEGGGAMVYYAKPAPFLPGLEAKILATVHQIVPVGFTKKTSRLEEMPRPLSPKEALASIKVADGLTVELVAAEPAVIDPVAIDFGGDRKLWVAEMRDYPMGVHGDYKPGGVIKLLEDRDGDGLYEHASVFLDKVPFPTGVMAWRKGVLVCAAPEIFYAEDLDGDGKADVRKSLYSGFATENYQARVNGLAYGLDNWVYGANGLIGGRIKALAGNSEFDLGARDFRIKPDQNLIEPASGLSQQGRIRNDWGDAFGNNNSILLQHYPFPENAARKNSYVNMPLPIVNVTTFEGWNVLQPISRPLERFNDPGSLNRVTSACGPAIYRDDRLGESFAGNAFICEPVHNVVRRLVLRAEGSTFSGKLAAGEDDREFLASSDNWFRPVQAKTGPDGALYIVDMYRYVIEHPRWISPERLAGLDVRAGDDKGRIYRIVATGKPLRKVADLEQMDSATLAKSLETRNGIIRDNVQRILVQRADKSASRVLERLAQASSIAECRAQALNTLDGLGALTSQHVLKGLNDQHPGVRRQAARLAGGLIESHRAIGPELAKLVDDPDPKVRIDAAISLGSWHDAAAGRALAKLAAAAGDDVWIRSAVLSSAPQHIDILLDSIIKTRDHVLIHTWLDPLISTALGPRDPGTAERLLAQLDDPKTTEPWRWLAMARVLDAVDTWGKAAAPAPALAQSPRAKAAIARARQTLIDPNTAVEMRIAAASLLGRDQESEDADRATLAELLSPTVAPELQAKVIDSLLRMNHLKTVLAAWGRLELGRRSQVLDRALSRAEWAAELLAAFEAKEIPVSVLDASGRKRMTIALDPALKPRAEKLLDNPTGDRNRLVSSYRQAMTGLAADSTRGEAVFKRICASCHKLGGFGHDVGPDLAALTDRSVDAYTIAILDPNREVDARYSSFTAALKDGRLATGLIAGESGDTILLKGQEGRVESIRRSELDELKGNGQSLMPEGLERDLKPNDLADLIAYLASNGSAAPPKVFAGNHPSLVRASDDGSIRLLSDDAAIHGDTLVYEPDLHNLGYWHSPNDEAQWNFSVASAGTYTMAIEYACADESAGNRYQIAVAGRTIEGRVGGTAAGVWSEYRSLFVGEVALEAGKQTLRISPVGPLQGALFDLRAVTLKPRIRLGAER